MSARWRVAAVAVVVAAWARLGCPAAAAAVCPRGPTRRCRALAPSGRKSHFNINGVGVTYEYIDGDFFAVVCPRSIALDEPALPRFEPALRVREVRLACAPPTHAGSYAAALGALNVTAFDAPAPGVAQAAPTYRIMLELKYLTKFEPDALTATSNLHSLNISNMITSATDLTKLPVGLERLVLTDTTIDVVPAATFVRLPHLARLAVYDKKSVLVEAAGNLTWLKINSPATRVDRSLPDALRWLELVQWAPHFPEPWLSCSGLDTLLLSGAAAETLPDGWVARCGRLRVLELATAMNLRSLSGGALHGASALREVRLRWGALAALPAGLLDDAPALRVLDLWDNHLLTLPGDLFKNLASLSELGLSKNSFVESVLGSLENVTSLSFLDLGNNVALDACSGRTGWSQLRRLSEVRVDGTATRRVCPAWLRLPRLRRLDLSATALERLTYADLRFNSTVDVIDVLLNDLNSMTFAFRREDYEIIVAAPAKPVVLLSLGGRTSLRCDCKLYWAAASIRHSQLRQELAICEDGRDLRDVPLEELVCSAAGAACPAGCACATREDAARPGPVLRVQCAGAVLPRVPRLDARVALRHSGPEPVALDLRLAGNRIARLGAEDLPPELTTLDLRNNSLILIDAATAEALVSRAARVLLAGNPLQCDCRAGAALAVMRAHTDVFQDWNDTTCSNGTRLASLSPCDNDETTSARGGLSRGAVVALALGAAAAVTAALRLVWVLLRRRSRLASRAQATEVLRLESLRPEPIEWSYDAFVSFAHADEAVVRELVEELEGGDAPLRLCVHYRDWVPGGWIPEQIATSVRVSRRTVALVSEAFLRSKWARAEFREAYAAALEDTEPRLVLVLLEEPALLLLDSELLAYISGNTYVSWGDPWFWQKLRAALSPHPASQAVT